MAGQEKNVFGIVVTPYKRHSELEADVASSPHAAGGNIRYQGEIGRGGVVIWSGDQIIGSVKGRKAIPRKIDVKNQSVKFGGHQARDYVEGNMAQELGMTKVRDRCKQILAAVKSYGMDYASMRFGGIFKIGAEVERFLADPQTGRPYRLLYDHQHELQSNLYETDVGVSANLREMALLVAQDAEAAAAQYPNALLNTTSMFMTGSPQTMEINNGKYQQYVAAVAGRMFSEFYSPVDMESRLVWDQVARDHGYRNFFDLKRRTGTLATLAFAAGHESLGLDNMLVDGHYKIPLELSVAVSQMFNSNQATFGEMVAYSTPIVYGRPVTYSWGGNVNHAQDARAVMRLASQTAYESPTVKDAADFKRIVSHAIVNQYADRLGRSAQISRIPQWNGPKLVASSHGRTRARIEQPSLFKNYDVPMGRQEFVGSPATPDITAAVARKAYLQLLGLGAVEALANGKYPIEYFRYKFPLLSGWSDQRELAHDYNFNGTGSKAARALLDEVVEYVRYMAKQYPSEDVEYAAEVVEANVQRMRQPAQARNLDDYLFSMEGMLPDVLANLYDDTRDPLQVSEQVHRFQIRQAQQVRGVRGDILKILPPVKKSMARRILGG
jgi:hypothetical protein